MAVQRTAKPHDNGVDVYTLENPPPEKSKEKFRTICEIHRELHYYISEGVDANQEKLLSLVSEAFDCGVRMNEKLVEYCRNSKNRRGWKKDVYQKNEVLGKKD